MSLPVRVALATIFATLASATTLGFITGIFGIYGWLVGKYFTETHLVDHLISQIYWGELTAQWIWLAPPIVILILTWRYGFRKLGSEVFRTELRNFNSTKSNRFFIVISIIWAVIWTLFCYFRLDPNHLFLRCDSYCSRSWESSDWILYFGTLLGLPTVLRALQNVRRWIGAGN